LHLSFFEDGNELFTEWEPEFYMQGYVNVLHGGIQATLHDEIASWTVYIKLQTAGVTSKLDVTYLKPVYINKGKITVRSKVISREEKLATMYTRLFDSAGRLCSEGNIIYFIYPQEIAFRRYYYPGINAFYD